jgi:hypothetical protein
MFCIQLAIIVLFISFIWLSAPMPTSKNKRSCEQSDCEKYAMKKKQKQVCQELNRMEINRRKKADSQKKQESSRILNE